MNHLAESKSEGLKSPRLLNENELEEVSGGLNYERGGGYAAIFAGIGAAIGGVPGGLIGAGIGWLIGIF